MSRAKEMSFEEGLTGAAFEVLLECHGGGFIGESEVSDQCPWFVLPGVRGLPAIVLGQPLFQVVRHSDVMLLPLVDTFQKVDVNHAPSVNVTPSFAKPTDGSLRLMPMEIRL